MRAGRWMQTYTGKAFWPLDPRTEEMDPLDIAHALSHQCRYGGHSKRFYSVAEHSILVSHAVDPQYALWGLLHDATEAYLVDVPRPIKGSLSEYHAIESRLHEVVAAKFGLPREIPAQVLEMDNRILLNEKDALMGEAPLPDGWPDLPPIPGVRIVGFSPKVARHRFLARLASLGIAPCS